MSVSGRPRWVMNVSSRLTTVRTQPPAFRGKQRGDQLDVERLGAAAEAAADVRLDHADARHVHVEGLRQHQMDVVRHLRRSMHRHAVALDVVVGDRGVHLHLVLADLGAVIDAVAHEVGLREALRHAAEFEQHVALDVAGLLGVQLHGIRRERVLCRIVAGQFPHLQPDQFDRPFGGGIVDGRHRRHRLAAITHLISCERVLAAGDRQHAEGLVTIGAGDDRLHARQLRGGRDIDFDDVAVRIRAAIDAPRQHAGLQDVGSVLGAARHLLGPVDQRHVAADIMRRHHLVHGRLLRPLRSPPPCGEGRWAAKPMTMPRIAVEASTTACDGTHLGDEEQRRQDADEDDHAHDAPAEHPVPGRHARRELALRHPHVHELRENDRTHDHGADDDQPVPVHER